VSLFALSCSVYWTYILTVGWLLHGSGGDASVAVLENENMRLREREQALMDAVGLRCVAVYLCLCCCVVTDGSG
jgi:hypothetical protein